MGFKGLGLAKFRLVRGLQGISGALGTPRGPLKSIAWAKTVAQFDTGLNTEPGVLNYRNKSFLWDSGFRVIVPLSR